MSTPPDPANSRPGWWNPANPGNALQLRAAEAAAGGVRLQPVEARGPGDIDKAFVAMTREHAGALLVAVDSMFLAHRERIAGLAAKNRLPAVYGCDRPERQGLS